MSGEPGEDWSAPDAAGIRTLHLDVGARATLRGRRRRRAFTVRGEAIAEWPEAWTVLLGEWLRPTSASLRWTTLAGQAGAQRISLADELREASLAAGLIEVEEIREAGRWRTAQLRFPDRAALRRRLGLADADSLRAEWQARSAIRFDDEMLAAAAATLDTQRPALALRRHALLAAAQRWIRAQRLGTRRDFSLFASDHTKAVSDADWDWLDTALNLEAIGISGHQPLLLIRAPLRLRLDGAVIDLAAAPDLLGLSPATVSRIEIVEGVIGCWRCVENRTSFERVAIRFGAEDAVVWLPGYPPTWWRMALGRLLILKPAPGRIACDPDPAGIAIALQAGAVWTEAGLAFEPWHMNAAVLAQLPALRPLNETDLRLLDEVESDVLPEPLRRLAEALRACGGKGEQEGLALD